MTDTASSPLLLAPRADGRAPGALHVLLVLVRFEARRWWLRPTGWIQTAVYLAAVAGIGGAAVLQAASAAPGAVADPTELLMAPFVMHLLFASAGVILTAQGAIVGERHDGTAAWVLARPVGRPVWLASKGLALLGSFVVSSVVLPLAALQAVWTFGGMAMTPTQLLVAGLAMSLTVAFWLAVTLLAGTLFDSRGAVSGLAFGTLFVLIQVGQRWTGLLPSGIPFELGRWLHDGTPMAVTGLVLTVGLALATAALATHRFSRMDL